MALREKVPLIVALIALLLALFQFMLTIYLVEIIKALTVGATAAPIPPVPRLHFASLF
ncbi:MAG: hypothetical protein HYU39_01545 [Thaumarchaeota archaeon]|nr:hypothetical protein [Nitrososphaerota archaeon]